MLRRQQVWNVKWQVVLALIFVFFSMSSTIFLLTRGEEAREVSVELDQIHEKVERRNNICI